MCFSSKAHSAFISHDERSKHFSYNTHYILFCVQLFITASVSYRACSKICGLLSPFIKMPVAHYTTIRQWVIRLGYYRLQKPKPFRDDWVYILDYTITTSKNKCLAILGVPLTYLCKYGFSPKMSEVELLHLSVTPKATWEVTCNALTETSKWTGIPAEIISDHGADVKKGTEEFCKQNPTVNYIYDITHMIACVLKSTLLGQPQWDKFIKQLMRCKHQTKQSVLSFLSPPSQRAKARYLNIAQIINWSKKILYYKEKGNFMEIARAIAEKNTKKHNICLTDNNEPAMNESIKLFNEKFNWINNFREKIYEYDQYINIMKRAKQEITTSGIHSKTIDKIKNQLKGLELTDSAIDLKDKIIDGIKSNIPKQLKKEEAYLGCSDIIESLIGKYKNYCPENSLIGITQSVLIMAAATSKLDTASLKKAMEYSIYSDIQKWSKKTIGESDFSKRKKVFKFNSKVG